MRAPGPEAGIACVCTDMLPDGTWTFTAYDGTSRPNCPNAYGTPNDVVENPQVAATQCSCQCNGLATQPTCDGNAQFTFGFGNNNNCNTRTGTITCGSTCQNTGNAGAGGNNGDYGNLALTGTIQPSGGSCNAAAADASVPAPTAQQGRACSLTGSTSSCNGGLAYVPDPGVPYVVCIAKAGKQMCPSGYPNTHYVGTGISDTRACGPSCNCVLSRGTCSTPQVRTYWGNTSCNSSQEWAGCIYSAGAGAGAGDF